MKQDIPYGKICFYFALLSIFVLAVMPKAEELPDVTKISDKLNHLVAFVVLALLIDWAYPQKRIPWKVALLSGYGLFIECVQYFLPYREFSLLDLAVDVAGIGAYFLTTRQLRGLRTED